MHTPPCMTISGSNSQISTEKQGLCVKENVKVESSPPKTGGRQFKPKSRVVPKT